MATATKNARTIQAAATNAAGASTTGTAVDLTTALGGLLTATVTNGATGPTVGCDAIVEISVDNTAWVEVARYTAGKVASTTYSFAFAVDESVLYARARFGGNTGQGVTVQAHLHELTGVS